MNVAEGRYRIHLAFIELMDIEGEGVNGNSVGGDAKIDAKCISLL